MSPKLIKFILSFIIAYVLSIFMMMFIHSPIIALLLIISMGILWFIIGQLSYLIILAKTNNKGISGLSGIIIGAIGMWIISNIVARYLEALEMAQTNFGVFVGLIPLALFWTFIIYHFANKADK